MGLILRLLIFSIISLTVISCKPLARKTSIPEPFIDVGNFIPSVIIDARYASSNNFTGKPVDGYFANKCLLTKSNERN